jgi:predicted ATP-grasp superfamily ATP-dependent carboligase
MNNTYKGHLVIVFAQEHYNPLGMIRGLGFNGINPIYISVKRRGEVATKSKFISKLHRVDTVEDGFNLVIKEYGDFDYDHRPFIVFSDDKCIGYFDEHYDQIKDKFIIYNAGDPGRISEFMDKFKVQQLAKKHGFHVLDSYVVKKGEIPEGLIYPIITKDISPNSGAWKSDVFICANEEELKKAYETIESPQILIQHFVDKKNELALQGYTINRGKEMQIITAMNWKYLIPGYYSPYHDVSMLNDVDMEKKLQAMFEEIGYEGVFEVEYLIDKDGTAYFLEINFRASCWNHTTNIADMAESFLWIKGMMNGSIDPADRKEFEPFTSMSEIIDYGKRVDSGKVTLAEWLRDFKEAKCTYYYHKDDMGPWEYVSDKWEQYK